MKGKKLSMRPTAAFVTIMPWFEWFGLNMLMMVASVLNRVHWWFTPSAHFQSKALLQNNLIDTAGQVANKTVSLEWAWPPSRLNKLSKHSSDRTTLVTLAGHNSGRQLRFVPSRYQRVHRRGGGVISIQSLAKMDKSGAVSAASLMVEIVEATVRSAEASLEMTRITTVSHD